MTAFRDLVLTFFAPAGVPGARPRPDPTLLPRAREAIRAPTSEEKWLLDTTAHALEARCARLERAVLGAADALQGCASGPLDPHVSAALDRLDEVIGDLRIGREESGVEEL